jgi:diguanylate cyclase (GGDEF)-like protein
VGFAVARRKGSAILTQVIPVLGFATMAKSKILLVDEAAARVGKRAERPEKQAPERAPEKPGRAAAKRLAAGVERLQGELAAGVERLQAELAAAHARITELETMADVDVLLDIFNRRSFERELRRAAAYVRRYGTAVALIYLDLDYFKTVNDRFGHAVGDSMLQAVAKTLQRKVRESDVVARLGGDEFGILLWNVSEIHTAAKARELVSAVAATVVMHAGTAVSVGASAGYAVLGSGDEPKDVISRADRAMYVRRRAARAAAG